MALEQGDRLAAAAGSILEAQPNPPRTVSMKDLVGVNLLQEIFAGALVLTAVGVAFLPTMPVSARSAMLWIAAFAAIGFAVAILLDLNQKVDALRRGVIATGRIVEVRHGSRGGPIIAVHVSLGTLEVDAPRQPWTFSSKPVAGQSLKLLADPVTGWPLVLLSPLA